ncbi:hypothetical protein ACFLS9_01675 [Bacteroidota bacterium]
MKLYKIIIAISSAFSIISNNCFAQGDPKCVFIESYGFKKAYFYVVIQKLGE